MPNIKFKRLKVRKLSFTYTQRHI